MVVRMTTTTAPSDLVTLVRATSDVLAAGSASPILRPNVTARLVPGTSTEVAVTAGRHEFTIDEPPALAGTDNGATPVEHLLAALASCQVITVKVWAAKLGITVDEVSVDLAGDIDLRGFFGVDDDVRPGYGDIGVNLAISGPESRETYDELIRQVTAHCPVLDSLTAGLPVTTTVTTTVTAA